MAASIRSTLYQTPGGSVVGPVLVDTSRDDLRSGYQVKCESVFDANTYAWTLAYTPDSAGPVSGSGSDFTGTPSSAALLPPEGSASKSCKFNVDWNGSYLIRLVTDAGLPTESTTFVRFRALTLFGSLKLTAAGERRDQTGVVPVDASAKGWAEDANQNMLRLLSLVRRNAVSGRVLYVDANRGRDNSADQNDPDNIVRFPGPDSANRDATGIRIPAIGFADFSSITDAIAYAQAAVARGEPALSLDNPYIINVAPGLYEENLNVPAGIYIIGSPSGYSGVFPTSLTGGVNLNPEVVRIRTVSDGTHEVQGSMASPVLLKDVTLESYSSAGALPYVLAVRGGAVFMEGVDVAHWVPGGRGVVNDPTLPCFLSMQGCSVISEESAIGILSQVPVAGSLFVIRQSTFISDDNTVAAVGRNINVILQYCWVFSGRTAFRGTPGNLATYFTTFQGDFNIQSGSVTHRINLTLNHCSVFGDMTLDGGVTSDTLDVYGGGTFVTGTLTALGTNVNQNWSNIIGSSASSDGTILPTIIAAGATYAVPDDVVVVEVTPPGTNTIQLPITPDLGRYIIVKDASGTAAGNPISVVPLGIATIEGAPNYTINSNWGVVRLIYSTNGGGVWHII